MSRQKKMIRSLVRQVLDAEEAEDIDYDDLRENLALRISEAFDIPKEQSKRIVDSETIGYVLSSHKKSLKSLKSKVITNNSTK